MEKLTLIASLTPDEIRAMISDVIEQKLKVLKRVDTEPDEYMTRQEVTEFLRISMSTLRDYTNRGILIGYKVGTRILYRRDQVKESIKEIEIKKYKRS